MAKYFVGTEEELKAYKTANPDVKFENEAALSTKIADYVGTADAEIVVASSTDAGNVSISAANVKITAAGEGVKLSCGIMMSGVKANGATISGFTFGSDAGGKGGGVIYLENGVSGVTIENNVFDIAQASTSIDAIRVHGCANVVISGNEFLKSNHHAINVSRGENVTIVNNVIGDENGEGIARSGIQIANEISGTLEISNNTISLSKTDTDRVDADDGAIVFSGEWKASGKNADLTMTGNEVTVSGSGADNAINGIFFGGDEGKGNPEFPSFAGMTGNTVNANDGAVAVKSNNEVAVDISGNDLFVDGSNDKAVLENNIVVGDNSGIAFDATVDGEKVTAGVGETDSTKNGLVDASIFYARATGEEVEINGVKYIVGVTLFGSLEDALNSGNDLQTIIVNGDITGDLTLTGGVNRVTIKGNGFISGNLTVDGLFTFDGFSFAEDSTLDLFAAEAGTSFKNNTFNGDITIDQDLKFENNTFNDSKITVDGAASLSGNQGTGDVIVNNADAVIKGNTFDSIELNENADISNNVIDSVVAADKNNIGNLKDNEIGQVVVPGGDSAAIGKDNTVDKDNIYTTANTDQKKVIVSSDYEDLEVGDLIVYNGRIYTIGTDAYASIDDIADATGLKSVTVLKADLSDLNALKGDATTATVYDFGGDVVLGDLMISGKVQIKNNLTVGKLTFETDAATDVLTIGKDVTLTVTGLIDADAIAGLAFEDAKTSKIQFTTDSNGNIVILGANAAAFFENINKDYLAGTGTIYIQGWTGSARVKNYNIVVAAMKEDTVNTLGGEGTPVFLDQTSGNGLALDLNQNGTATSNTLIYATDVDVAGDISVKNGGGTVVMNGTYTGNDSDLTIRNSGKLTGEDDSAIVFTGIKFVSGSIFNDRNAVLAADITGTGAVTIENSGTLLDFDLETEGKVTVTNNEGALWDGGSVTTTGDLALMNNGIISDVEISANNVEFDSAVQGTYEDIKITATEIFLAGANFGTAAGSDVTTINVGDSSSLDMSKIKDRYANGEKLVLGKGFEQEITVSGESTVVGTVTNSLNKAVLSSTFDRAKDVLSYVVNVEDGATVGEITFGPATYRWMNADGTLNTTDKAVNNINVELTVNQVNGVDKDGNVLESILNGDVTNTMGGITSGTGLVFDDAVDYLTARDAIVISGDLKGYNLEVEAGKTLSVTGDVNVYDIEASDKVTIGGSLVISDDVVINASSAKIKELVLEVGGETLAIQGELRFAANTVNKVIAGNANITVEGGLTWNVDYLEARSIATEDGDIALDDADIVTNGRVMATNGAITAKSIHAGVGTVATVDAGYAFGIAVKEEIVAGAVISAADIFAKSITTVKDAATQASGNVEAVGDIGGEAKEEHVDFVNAEGSVKANAAYIGTLTAYSASFEDDLFVDNVKISGRDEEGNALLVAGDVKKLNNNVKGAVIDAASGALIVGGGIEAGSIKAQDIRAMGGAVVADTIEITEGGDHGGVYAEGIDGGRGVEAKELTGASYVTAKNGDIFIGEIVGAESIKTVIGGDLESTGEIRAANGSIYAGKIVTGGTMLAGGYIEVGNVENGVFKGGSIDSTADITAGSYLLAGSVGSAGKAVKTLTALGNEVGDKTGIEVSGNVFAGQIDAKGDASIKIGGTVTMTRSGDEDYGNISSANDIDIKTVAQVGSVTAEGDIVIDTIVKASGAIVSKAGTITIDSLGSVGGKQTDKTYEGFAIWAMNTNETSSLGFAANSVINGDIGLGYGVDVLDLTEAPTINGTVFMGGVENEDEFDVLKVGRNAALKGDIDLSKSAGPGDVYGNLSIEGGTLDLAGRKIYLAKENDVVSAELSLSLAGLSNAQIFGGKLDLTIDGDTTISNSVIGRKLDETTKDLIADQLKSFTVADGKTVVFDFTNALFEKVVLGAESGMSLINNSTVTIESPNADNGEYSYFAGAAGVSIAGKSTLFLYGGNASGNATIALSADIAVSGASKFVLINSEVFYVLDGALTLQDRGILELHETLQTKGKTISLNASSEIHIRAYGTLILDATDDGVDSTLTIENGSHLRVFGGDVVSNGATVTLKDNAYIENANGNVTFRGGKFNIDNTKQVLETGYTFEKQEILDKNGNLIDTEQVDINLKNSELTISKDVLAGFSFDNVVVSGEGNAVLNLEGRVTSTLTKRAEVAINEDFAIDNIQLSVIPDSNPLIGAGQTTVLFVDADITAIGNFSVTVDVLHVYATTDISVTITTETNAGQAMFNVGTYEGFALDTPGQGVRITVNAQKLGASEYLLATGEYASNFTVGSGLDNARIINRDGNTYLVADTPAEKRSRTDIIGNGSSQILAYDKAGGNLGYIAMEDGKSAGWKGVWSGMETFEVAGTGRFEFNGAAGSKDGILLINKDSGTLAAWTDLGRGDYGYVSMGWVGTKESEVSGVAYNLGGKSNVDDVLVTTKQGFGIMVDGKEWHSVWDSTSREVIAAGGFGGRYDSIVVKEANDDIYLMNSTTPDGNWNWNQTYVGNASGWDVVGIGDFSADGVMDIVLQNATTGEVGFWMDGKSSQWVNLGSFGDYKVESIGDFNGNGKDDLLFRNQNDGKGALAYVDGADVNKWNDVGARVESKFSIIA